MKNDLSNTATALAPTLTESVRIPLHSLQADLEYLIGRVIADSSCGPMIVKSMKDRLDQIEKGILAPAQALKQPDADELRPSEFWAGKASAAFVLAGEIKLRKQLAEALQALLNAVKAEPAMRGRQFVGLGIQVTNALSAAEIAPRAWECMGRKQSLPEPGECNWPDCGCDPNATNVIENLIEQGWSPPQPSTAKTVDAHASTVQPINAGTIDNILSKLDQGAAYQGYPEGFGFSWTGLCRDAATIIRRLRASALLSTERNGEASS